MSQCASHGGECTPDAACWTDWNEVNTRLANALLQIEKLKDKYDTCEQCDGSTDAGVFCVPCWNRVNLQKYEAAAKYLRAEAKKIPLGEGNVQKGFSSTYNALEFAAQVLEDATERLIEKPNPEPCGEVFDGEQKCLLPKPCRLHTEKRKDEKPCGCPGSRDDRSHLTTCCERTKGVE